MAKKAKYGYRRNYYGNVVEDDRIKEEEYVNEYHDNSDYDPEDDNDSLYQYYK